MDDASTIEAALNAADADRYLTKRQAKLLAAEVRRLRDECESLRRDLEFMETRKPGELGLRVYGAGTPTIVPGLVYIGDGKFEDRTSGR